MKVGAQSGFLLFYLSSSFFISGFILSLQDRLNLFYLEGWMVTGIHLRKLHMDQTKSGTLWTKKNWLKISFHESKSNNPELKQIEQPQINRFSLLHLKLIV